MEKSVFRGLKIVQFTLRRVFDGLIESLHYKRYRGLSRDRYISISILISNDLGYSVRTGQLTVP